MTDAATEEKEAKVRRARGNLEADVRSICDQFMAGKIELSEGEHLTPHRIASFIKTQEELEAPPSVGAVAAVLARWEKIGFAEVEYKPFRFIDLTAKGRADGLEALKAEAAAERREERKKLKAAEASTGSDET